MIHRRALVLAAVAAGAVLTPALAQGFRNVTIETTELSRDVYMLKGRGGNIGLCAGDDGAFLIDDQFAPLSGRIAAAIAEVTDEPVRFVLNTHWHPDHTGGNENFGKEGAHVVAHDNVRVRMSRPLTRASGRETPAAAEGALPVITFSEEMTFHWNGWVVHVFHVAHAHTDGDSIVHFSREKAQTPVAEAPPPDVFHMGDVYFNGMYPFVDVETGGDVSGVIAAVDRVLALAAANARIIPGHGPASNPRELLAYREMLATSRAAVAKLVVEGADRDAVIAAKPSARFDEVWGGGFINPEQFAGMLYDCASTARRLR